MALPNFLCHLKVNASSSDVKCGAGKQLGAACDYTALKQPKGQFIQMGLQPEDRMTQ